MGFWKDFARAATAASPRSSFPPLRDVVPIVRGGSTIPHNPKAGPKPKPVVLEEIDLKTLPGRRRVPGTILDKLESAVGTGIGVLGAAKEAYTAWTDFQVTKNAQDARRARLPDRPAEDASSPTLEAILGRLGAAVGASGPAAAGGDTSRMGTFGGTGTLLALGVASVGIFFLTRR